MIGISLINRKNFLVGSLSLVITLFIASDWSAIAGTFSIKEISVQIARKTSVPILLPSEQVVEKYKFNRSETMYAYLDTYSDSDYSVRFNNRSGNVGNAAFRFSVSAKRGKDFKRRAQDPDPRYAVTFSQLKLFDNSNALITSWCGGTACWSTVQWKSNDVLYEVVAKEHYPTALAIANSAIREGNRSKR